MLGIGTVARLVSEVSRDVQAARERDPAARGVTTVGILTTWPGVHALLTHRVAHALDAAGVPVVPRVLAASARAVTGVEIHPSARVGEGLFIDHGSGVVIGETVELGGTSWMTTALAPILEPWPTRIGPSSLAPEPIVTFCSTVGWRLPVAKPVPPSVTPW